VGLHDRARDGDLGSPTVRRTTPAVCPERVHGDLRRALSSTRRELLFSSRNENIGSAVETTP
jgi:hypothetical protein